MDRNLVAGVSFWGSIASMIGILITIWQTIRIQSNTKATQKAIEETRKELNRTLTVYNVAKHNEMIKRIQDYLRETKPEIALYLLRDLRPALIEIKEDPIFKNTRHLHSMASCIVTMGMDIGNIEKTDFASQSANALDINRIIINLDELSSILSEVEAKLKHNTL